jgi:hypothetical protein
MAGQSLKKIYGNNIRVNINMTKACSSEKRLLKKMQVLLAAS